MGRPIAGQYHVPVNIRPAWALIDAETMSMQIGDKVYGKPESCNMWPPAPRLTRDDFWKILENHGPVNVRQFVDKAYIKLATPYKRMRTIRMKFLESKSQ